MRLLVDAGFEVVAEAADAPDLLRKVSAHKPDLAIVDVQMPPDNTDDGLRAALEIRGDPAGRRRARARAHAEERYAVDLIGDSAEGVGYLLKDRVTDFTLFADAVKRVAAGGSVLDPTVVAHMLGRRRRDDPLEALTPREREVLELMAEGRSNKGIAEALVVTPHAVEKHVTSIFSKLGVTRRHRGPPARARRAHVPRAHNGNRARTSVPSPVRALDLERAVERADTVAQAAQPACRAPSAAPPTPSSRMSTTRGPVLAPDLDPRVGGVGVLGDVGQRLGDDEVGRGLDRARQALLELALELHRDGRAAGQRLQRGVEAALGEHGGMDAGGEVAQLADRRLALANALSTSSRAPGGSDSKRSRASWSSIISATSRCCAPSCRSRPSRRRSASPASTSRARDARSASSRARSSTSSRAFSSASAGRGRRLAQQLGLSHSTSSWMSAPTQRPSCSMSVSARPGPGSATGRPRVDVPGLGQPVRDLERRVAELDGERVAHAARVLRQALDHAADGRGAEEARPHQPEQERPGTSANAAKKRIWNTSAAPAPSPFAMTIPSPRARITAPSSTTGSRPRRWAATRGAPAVQQHDDAADDRDEQRERLGQAEHHRQDLVLGDQPRVLSMSHPRRRG